MAALIYSAIASLDGYVADQAGSFDWAEPSEEVHAFANDLSEPIGTYLFGRRMYEVMRFWDTALGEDSPVVYQDFADLWQSADKIVYSRTLTSADSARTSLERDFRPDAVRQLKASSERDIAVGGPGLAGQALRAGLVDECQLFLVPVLVGGGLPLFPADIRQQLTLVDERRFGNGTVYLRYRI